MIIPSSARNVSGAQLTRTHPERSRPLKRGTKPSRSATGPDAQPRAKSKATADGRRMGSPSEGAERVFAVLHREGHATARELGGIHGQDHLERRARFEDVDRRAPLSA